MKFKCTACVDEFEREVAVGEQLPMFPLCPACEELLQKAEDEE